ncbi:SDR family NAD(P)-dependent oxidoreductase [Mucilaginibacter sp. SP1R1]|uniref:SDR family NAD(P)-dependent oxidoreductase n=1 Tax=Mucilaginibacter sp. SP1R1 TaxID=2723091 RepID=UPI00160E024C|nr:SDR family NAD(P)-dependent oxidoreductase [Mucilaginibacter sp. SP1R1]MBB6151601.1 NAD(P)-dependent dehydrogenase (short-subunit alcohol dehydrogenase family) [Mucilaginibacter sp. SP1R1]
MDNNKKVWFITGASKGFGLSLVKQLLDAGQLVAATSRNQQELIDAVNIQSNNFLPLQVDLVNESSVSLALQHTHEAFGRIDVVINNAGYGIGGAIEELTDKETRLAFDVNVFATLNVIRFVMPYLRKQRSGHIINISSIAGIAPGTGWAIYGAAKYAVIGLSEVLAADVKSLGVKVTVVAPGAFRTNFLTPDSLTLTSTPIEDYEDVRASHAKYLKMDGEQAGDPEKAAASIIKIAGEDNPPLYLLLGGDAYNRALNKLDTLHNEIREWQDLTCSTDFEYDLSNS